MNCPKCTTGTLMKVIDRQERIIKEYCIECDYELKKNERDFFFQQNGIKPPSKEVQAIMQIAKLFGGGYR